MSIQALMGEGDSRKQICEKIAKQYKISPRTAERQYDQIVKALELIVEEGRAELRAKLMTRNDLIYKKSLQEGKFKTALDANMAQAKLGGLGEKAESTPTRPEIITIRERGESKLGLVGDGSGNDD